MDQMRQVETKAEQTAGGFAWRWTLPFVAIIVAHFMMDIFSSMVPASLGIIQERWQLSDRQSAWFLGVGSLVSGLAQPMFAWLSDRTDNRVFGGLGLAISAVMISSFGLASSPVHLFAFYIFGMLGNGMFHPVAASTIGQIKPARRSLAVSLFFVAGMFGGITGATFGPRLLATRHGFDWLLLAMIPALAAALFLHLTIRKIEHRHVPKETTSQTRYSESQWSAVAWLYAAAAVRFTVNMALIYMYVRWMAATVGAQHPSWTEREIAETAAPLTGNLNAATFAGMAVGGFSSGALIPGGSEKKPLIVMPLLFAPVIAFFPMSGPPLGMLLAFAAGVGFAAMVPVTTALAQRLMPSRTSLASGLMLGGAWSVGMLGPVLAQISISEVGIDRTFYLVASLLAVSGILALPIRSSTIKSSVESPLR